MSGFLGALAAVSSGAVVSPLTPLSLTCFGLLGTTHSGTINFNTDGTISRSVSSPDSSSILSNWFLPTTAAIGSSFFIRFVLSTGTTWTAGLVDGTLYSLSVVRSLSWTATTGNFKLANVAVTIYSDVGGTNLVGSGTLSVDIESSN